MTRNESSSRWAAPTREPPATRSGPRTEKGPLAVGGHDLVSENGIFRGAKGILSPFQRLPIFNWIRHNFVFNHHWHPEHVYPRGMRVQETKP